MRQLLCAAMVVLAVPVALAGEPPALEPSLQLSWDFGGSRAQWLPKTRLGLYPGDVAWRRMCADLGIHELADLPQRPELAGVEVGRDMEWRLGGVALDGEGGSEPNWPLRIGVGALVVVGVGALALHAVGDAWGDGIEDAFTPPEDEGGDDDEDVDGGLICLDGQCLLPCDPTGPINSCNGG